MEKKLKKGRWFWYLGAAGAMIGYLLASGLVQIGTFDDEDLEDEENEVEVDSEGVEEVVEIGPEAEIVVVEVVEPEVNAGDAAA